MGSVEAPRFSTRALATLTLGAAALLGLYLLSLRSYVLFHSVAEISTISVGLSIFFLVWNSRQHLDTHYLLFIGISSLFVSGIDLLHALEYNGMGVFPGTGSNRAMQLWIAGRYLQVISLVLALRFVRRKARVSIVVPGFVLAAAAVLSSLYAWRVFPESYVEGSGPTLFLTLSEYAIMLLAAVSLAGLAVYRKAFERGTLHALSTFLVLTTAAELTATIHLQVFGPSNVAGHLVRLAAYYFLYRGIVVTGLRRPYELLYRDLARSRDALANANTRLEEEIAVRTADLRQELADRRKAEEAVRESQRRYKEVFENVSDALFVFEVSGPEDLRLVSANPGAEHLVGMSIGEALGRPVQAVAPPELMAHALRAVPSCVQTGIPAKGDFEVVLPRLGKRYLSAIHLPIREEEGPVRRLIVAIRDITDRVGAERSLRESEQKFRTLVEQSVVGIAMIQGEHFVFVNERLAEILGYPRSEMESLSPLNLFASQDLPRIRANIEGTERGPMAVIHFRARGRHRDGTERHVEVHGTRIHLGGTPTWIGILVDITEQVEKEAALVYLNRLHRSLSRANALIVQEKDSTRLLQEICRICVQDGGALMAWVGLIDRDSLLIVPAAWAGKEEGYLSAVRFSAQETTFGRGPAGRAFRDNRHVVIEDIASEPSMTPWRGEAISRGYHSVAVFPLSQNGSSIGVIATYSSEPGFYTSAIVGLLDELAMDISYALENLEREAQRARAVELMRESNDRFRELTDSIREAFWMTSADEGRTLYVSRGYEEIWQRPRDEVFANPNAWVDFLHPEDRARMKDVLGAPRTDYTFDGEYRIVRPDGTVRWIHDRAFPVKDRSGRVIRVAGIAEDVTAGKEAEENLRRIEARRRELEQQLLQSQRLESLGTLASGVAHDFNNILAIILGHAYLLDEEGETRYSKSIRSILKAADRGAALVKQLLTIARKTEMKLEPTAVGEMVVELSRLLLETFPKTVTVKTEVPPGLPLVTVDAGQIHQMLMNLCINARDAMPGGGVLTISASRVDAGQVRGRSPDAKALSYVRIRVSDTGVGMDEETRRRVYEPFFTTKAPGRGTGLGLSLVRSIVERHRGMIDMTSALGTGTTFEVYLPVDQLTRPDGASSSALPAADAGGREIILVIEDEESLLEALAAALVEKGYTVLSARDGEEGVELFRRHRREIAVVLSDFGLPKLDGAEVTRRVRALEPGVKVILTSGEIDPARNAAIAAAGSSGFLRKPCLPSEAIRFIRRVLDSRPGGGGA